MDQDGVKVHLNMPNKNETSITPSWPNKQIMENNTIFLQNTVGKPKWAR